jgi:hypothetical protein
MGIEQSLTPNSERGRVQRESTDSFSYGSALEALLGMPDVAGKHVSSPRMLPPVQSRYATQSFLAEALPETDLTGFDDEEATHDPASSAGSPGAAVPHHGPFAGKGLSLPSVPPQPGPMGAPARHANPVVAHRASQPGISISHTSRQRDTDATSEHDRGFGAATVRVERPDQVPEEIDISVPGISARLQHSPALTTEKQDERPVSTAGEGEGAARARGHQRGTGSTEPPERGGLSAVERQSASAGDLMAESEKRASGRLRGIVESSVSGDVAASIDQLRRTLKELAAKVASGKARTQDETPTQQTVQTPPPAVQRVVIIKPAAPRSGPPRAFWERSYLGRWSWRTLR